MRTIGSICFSLLFFIFTTQLSTAQTCGFTGPSNPFELTLYLDASGNAHFGGFDLDTAAYTINGSVGVETCDVWQFYDSTSNSQVGFTDPTVNSPDSVTFSCGTATADYINAAGEMVTVIALTDTAYTGTAPNGAGDTLFIHVTILDTIDPSGPGANVLDETVACDTIDDQYIADMAAQIENHPNTTDNCADTDISVSFSDSTFTSFGMAMCPVVGQLELDYILIDGSGNTSLYTVTVSIEDNEAPVWRDPSQDFPPATDTTYNAMTHTLDVTLDCNDPDFDSDVMAWMNFEPEAFDSCFLDTTATVSLVFQDSMIDCTPPAHYTNFRKWVATDDCNETPDSFDLNLTFIDTVSPSWDPGDGAILAQDGSGNPIADGDTATYTLSNAPVDCDTNLIFSPEAVDCQGLNYSWDIVTSEGMPPATTMGLGNTVNEDFPSGIHTIEWTAAEDSCDNGSATYGITVVVQDNQAPQINFNPTPDSLPGCGDTMTVYATVMDCQPLIAWQRVVNDDVDDCGLDTIIERFSQTPSGFAPHDPDASSPNYGQAEFQLGLTRIRYIAIDVDGNSDTCDLYVDLRDTIGPSNTTCVDYTLNSICDSIPLPDIRGNAGFDDNCNVIDTVFQMPDPGTYLVDAYGGNPVDGGTFIVKIWSDDASGNASDTCEITVTMENDSVPVPALVGLDTINPETTPEAGCGMVLVDAPVAFICNNADTIYGAPTTGNWQSTGDSTVYQFNPGNYTVVWEYTAPNNNTTTQNQEFMVTQDTTAPLVKCPVDVIVNPMAACDTSNIDGINLVYVSPTFPYSADSIAPGEYTDNCGIDTVEYELSGATTVTRKDGVDAGIESFNPGVTTVTYYVTDDGPNANETSCSFTVTVIDDEAPVISCPPDDTVQTLLDTCAGAYTWTHPTPTDNCDSVVLTCDNGVDSMEVIPGTVVTDTFPAGTTTITYLAIDSAGNTTSCSFSITVNDSIAPQITCVPDVTLNLSDDGIPGDCLLNMNSDSLDAVATDTCGMPGLVNDYTNGPSLNGADFPLGNTTVIWTATDNAGNTATCSHTITVVDNEPPSITCPSNVTLTAGDCDQLYCWSVDTAGGCDIDTLYAYFLDDEGNVDNNINYIQTNCNGEDGFIAEFEAGITEVHMVVRDTSGISDTCSFTVTVESTSEPNVTCNNYSVSLDSTGQFVTDTLPFGELYQYSNYCGLDSVFISHDTVTCADLGDNTFTVIFYDVGGQSDTCSGTLTVSDTLNPYIACQSDTMLHLPDSMNAVASLSATSVIDSMWDNCTIDSVLISKDGLTFDTTATYDCSDIGTQTAVLKVVDQSGNSASCTVSVMVKDTTSPGVVACLQDTMINTSDGGTGDCEGQYIWTHPDVTDNCIVDSMTVSYNLSTGTVIGPDSIGPNTADTMNFPAGMNTVTYVVYDANGNSSDSCDFKLSVLDDEDPMPVCPPDTMVTTAGDSLNNYDCGYTVSGGIFDLVDSMENCLVDSAWHDYAAAPDPETLDGAVFMPDTTVVTWTVLDTSGNTGTCSFSIVVKDSTPPMITCPGDVTLSSGSCDDDYCWTVDTTDNCALDTTYVYFEDENGNPDPSVTLNQISCNGEEGYEAQFELGVTYVFVVTRDTVGNADTCMFSVTVSPNNTPPQVTCTNDYMAFLDSSGQFVLDTLPYGTLFTYTSVCDVDTITIDPDTVHCADFGIRNFTVTVLEQGGQQGSCTGTVQVKDTITPYLACQGDTMLHLPDTMNAVATLSATSVIDSVWDNCTPDSILISKDGINYDTTVSYACSDVGTQTAIVKVVDIGGNTATCSVQVMVKDTTSPGVVACIQDTVINTSDGGSGDCEGQFIWTHPDVTDNCTVDSMTVSYSLSTGTVIGPDSIGPNTADTMNFPAGMNTVTYVVYDANGNSSDTCDFKITVLDDEAPLPVCISDTVVTTAGDSLNNYDCAYTATGGVFDLVDSVENCVVDSAWHDYTAAPDPETLDGAEFMPGTDTITWTVLDTAGNMNTCSFTVSVLDTELPTFTSCPANDTVAQTGGNSCDVVYTYDPPYEGSGVMDNCVLDTVIEAIVDSPPNTFPGFIGDDYQFDDPDGSRQVELPVGTTTIRYTAFDTSGNSSICEFSITVTDNNDPTLVCNDITVNLDSAGMRIVDPSEISLISEGNCAEIDTQYLSQDTFLCTDIGSNTVLLTVVDEQGNSSTCTAEVFVRDVSTPIAMCTAYTASLNAAGDLTVHATDFDDNSTDNCTIVSYEFSVDGGQSYNTSVVYDCSDAGSTFNVLLRVTDQSGNSDECSTTLAIVDDSPPSFTCPSDRTVNTSNNGTGDCTAESSWNTPSPITDNCGFDNLSYMYSGATSGSGSATPGASVTDTFNEGMTVVTYTATDINGNSSSCTFKVTVVDNEAPMISCAASDTVGTSEDNIPDSCAYVVPDDRFDPVSVSDNCPGLNTATHDYGNAPLNTTLEGASFPLNVTTTVTWTVVDAEGNSSACTLSIRVVDDEAPVFNECPNNITMNGTINGGCDQNVTWAAPFDVIDTCGMDDVVETVINPDGDTIIPNYIYDWPNQNLPQGLQLAQFPVGTSTVTYTAYDVNGNSSTCSFTVTITEDEEPNAICEDVTVSLDANGTAVVSAEDVGDNSDDNCHIDTMYLSQDTFTCAELGSNTVILTVVDEVGNSDQCTATVTVLDEIDPTLSCMDITVYLDANGQTTVLPSDVEASSDDNCSVLTWEIAKAGQSVEQMLTFDCSEIGSNEVVLRVTDQSANSTTCTATVTVLDSMAPSLTCPANMTVNTSSNNVYDCVGNASWTIPVPGENCALDRYEVTVSGATNYGTTSVIDDQGEMTTYSLNAGINTITYEAEDTEGNVSSCSFTVTVLDDQAPQVTCAADATVNTSADGNTSDCMYTVQGSEFDPVNTSDNCGVASSTHNYSAPSNTTLDDADLPAGTTTVTWTVEDDEGNTTTCSVDITVTDDQAPVVSDCPADVTVQATSGSCDQDVSWDLPFDITDNCGIASVDELVDDPNVNMLHEYDFFNQPEIVGEAQFPVGVTTISYVATDVNGNTHECSFTVTVEDSEAPTVICPEDQILGTICPEAEFPDYRGSAEVSDNCGSGFSLAQDPAAGTTLEDILGGTPEDGDVIPVTITVTDEAPPFGSATCTFTVTLDETNDPIPEEGVAGEQLPTLYGTTCGDGTFTIVPPTATDPDNCDGPPEVITAYMTPNDPYPTGITENNDSTYEAENGNYFVTWIYDDGEGNTVSQPQQIVVEGDDTPPEMACQDITVSLNGNGTASIDPEDVDGGSMDVDCEIVSLSLSRSSFDCSDLGVVDVTLTAEDENGNTASCSAEVNVIDDLPPIAVCQDITVEISPQGTVTIDPSDLDGGSSDNCTVDLDFSASQTTFFCSNIGEEIITLTVTDDQGNSSTCTSTVTVEEDVAPFAHCQDITVQVNANGSVTIDPEDVDDGSDDVCGSVIPTSVVPNTFDCDDAGTNTVILTVTDDEGTTASCTAEVTVVCDGVQMVSVEGDVLTEDNEGVLHTVVSASGGSSDEDETDANGAYLLSVPEGADITVTPFKDTLPKAGISTLDLVIIQMHILQIDALSSPYKIIAADASNDGHVSTFDLVQIQSLLLGNTANFPNNTSWRFVDAEYSFPDPSDPWAEVFPESVELLNVDGTESPVDFTGIKIGDVNDSNNGNLQGGDDVEGRSGSIEFHSPDRTVRPGELFEIPVRMSEIEQLYGYQTTLEWMRDIRFEEVEVGSALPDLSASNFKTNAEEGWMNLNWYHAQPVSLRGDEVLFTLRFRAKEEISSLRNVLFLTGNRLRSEAYPSKEDVLNLQWVFGRSAASEAFALYQNRPNPFDESTSIGFRIPYDSEVRLYIVDEHGKRIFEGKRFCEQGYNEWLLHADELKSSGMLYYRMVTDRHTAVKKMIIQQ